MDRSSTLVRAIVSVLIILGLGAGPATAAPLSPGDILVADQGGTIHHFSASGADLGFFASGLASPSWITADPSGNIYVSEYTGGRVVKLSPAGVNLLTITVPYSPGGVAVGSDGTIYVGDYFGGNVYRYSASGAALGLFVSTGLARADFLRLDAGGSLYVTDFFAGVVRRISPSGEDLGDFVSGFAGAEGSRLIPRAIFMSLAISPASSKSIPPPGRTWGRLLQLDLGFMASPSTARAISIPL